MASKPVAWTDEEVETLLCLVADDRVQRELDGATRNQRVYREVSERMAAHGYPRTVKQCREKLKELQSDYRAVKEHSGRSGSKRRDWEWFSRRDAIYGRRPASDGFELGLALLETMIEDDKEPASSTSIMDPPSSPAPPTSTSSTSQRRAVHGKRKRGHRLDLPELLAEMRADEERNRAERHQHIQLLLNEAREAREHEAALQREQMAQTAAFNQAFLGVLGQLVQVMSSRRV
ncbi:zinc finger and SCAN domain-containing protein 20-like [Myripristis murdjan]|uniref:zinc finger and SCAN domain-containing protein 20-like n=1 Tax=Myripristis murdjan TaxID=586833 RepID=UPI0011761794|nr:zinc finger and SCAN domain-containing protein 20-like [Myripristis murdjan]